MENTNEIKISIPKPCHEDWNKMSPNEQGAFCMKCAKTVVDFTKKTTEEIKDFLIQQSGQKVCGRFMTSQLEEAPPRKFIDLLIPIHLLPQKLPFYKAFAFALFITFGTTLFSCSTMQGEVVGKISPVIDTPTVNTTELPANERITGDTIYNINEAPKPIKEVPTGKQNCTTLKGDVAIEKTQGEVVATPKDSVKHIEELKIGKIKTE